MDKLNEFLEKFDTKRVTSIQEMLRLSPDTKIKDYSLFKYSLAYTVDPKSKWKEEAEEDIIKFLKDKINKLSINNFATNNINDFIGINILSDFVTPETYKQFKSPIRLIFTAYVYPKYSPEIINNNDYTTRQIQIETFNKLVNYLQHNNILIDLTPRINRQIGKTTLIISQAKKELEYNSSDNPKIKIITPSYRTAKNLNKTKLNNSKIKAISISEFNDDCLLERTSPNTYYFIDDVPIEAFNSQAYTNKIIGGYIPVINQTCFPLCFGLPSNHKLSHTFNLK